MNRTRKGHVEDWKYQNIPECHIRDDSDLVEQMLAGWKLVP